MSKKIPFDFIASLDIPNWREDFYWVVSEDEYKRIHAKIEKEILAFAKSLASDIKKQNVFLLAINYIWDRMNGLLLATIAIQKSQQQNIDLVSTLDEVSFIKTGDKKYLRNKKKQTVIFENPKFMFLRRAIRTLSWTPWWRFFNSIVKPEIIAISHNEILREKAKLSDQSIYFYQGNLFLNAAKKVYKQKEFPQNMMKLIDEIMTLFINNITVETRYLERLKYLANILITHLITDSFHNLESLYQYNNLPNHIWMGTAKYANRAIALATLYQGGKVVSFAHATGTVLTASFDKLLIHELAVTSKFITLTAKASQHADKHYTETDRNAFHNFIISHILGSPTIEKYAINTNKCLNKNPVVLYTSNAMRELEYGAPLAYYMVYLDWQLRLVDILQSMDIELICQPHPEGIFKNRALIHPLREKLNIPYRKFEEVMEHADIFLVDFIHSTTFGEILVTDKPVVRISLNDDSHYGGVSDDIKPLLDRRCRKVNVNFGNDNLPYIDEKELERAIMDNWQEKVDSTEFRELLLG